MQYFLDGYRKGDPRIRPAAEGRDEDQPVLPDDVDVLIVGSGPAGLLLAAQLSEFPEIVTRVVERAAGPLEVGRADGVNCRTVETFEAFGLAERMMAEAYWVNETRFWGPDPADPSPAQAIRTGPGRAGRPLGVPAPHRQPGPPTGFPARAHAQLPEPVAGRLRSRGHRGAGPELRRQAGAGHPSPRRRLGNEHPGQVRRGLRRSPQRCAPVDRPGSHGYGADKAWGVMDLLAVTDFPDIRLKATIQSGDGGNILLIPREGGYLVRLYVDMGEIAADAWRAGGRHRAGPAGAGALHVGRPRGRLVSVYRVGHRVTDKFDDVDEDKVGTRGPRVFIAGDACHTHTAKAGQGMNVSMQDTYNLGWKLAAVLQGRAPRACSIPTRRSARSSPRTSSRWTPVGRRRSAGRAASTPTTRRPCRQPSPKCSASSSPTVSSPPGWPPITPRRCSPARTPTCTWRPAFRRDGASNPRRWCGSAMPRRCTSGTPPSADGRWRLYAFADAVDPRSSGSRLSQLLDFLGSEDSPVHRYTPAGWDPDGVFDVRAVIQQSHYELEWADMPEVLKPHKGAHGLIDYEKVFTPSLDGDGDIFDLRGIDRGLGALVVVRPDQYVSLVLPLDGYQELSKFFDSFMTPVS